MKRIICDWCGAHGEQNEYGMAPIGSDWLTVSRRKDFKSYDYCSVDCAVKAMTSEVVGQLVVAAPPVADPPPPFPETSVEIPAPPVVAHEVARMHDEGNPNDREEIAF